MVIVRSLVVAALAVTVAGCGSEGEPGDAVAFARVDLPRGLTPTALAADGDALVVGGRWADRPIAPGLARLGADGRLTEIPLVPATPYGEVARWTSVTAENGRILAVGGERGGAHGNVRWSVWTGSAEAVVERRQGAATFGGYGAGDLVGGVLTANGPVVVGAWESARAAMDVAVWTVDGGHVATRRSSAGTALESTREEIGFPTAVAELGADLLIAGWQVRSAGGVGGQVPVVWRSAAGVTGWAKAVLPDSGKTATADAITCWATGCAVTGRVDGAVAAWRLADGAWARLAGMPPIPADDRQPAIAPVEVDGRIVVAVPHEGRVRLLEWQAGTWTARETTGLRGAPAALTRAGGTTYLVTETDDGARTLWRATPG